MRHVVEYQTIVAPNPGKMDDLVKEALVKGWEPIGGIAFYQRVIGNSTTQQGFIQAVVKYSEPPPL